MGALAEVYGGRLLEYGAFDLVRAALTLGDTEDFVDVSERLFPYGSEALGHDSEVIVHVRHLRDGEDPIEDRADALADDSVVPDRPYGSERERGMGKGYKTL